MSLNEYVAVFSRSFFFALATLLPFLNPPALAPIFWTLTEGASNASRLVMAKRVALNVGLMLIVAMVAGNVLLSFFGLTLSFVKIGGGVLVISSAWRLVHAANVNATPAARVAEAFTPEKIKAHAFYPLTFPISCGPGAIAAAITVGASLRDEDHLQSLVRLAGSLPGIIVVSLTLYVCLRFAAQLLHRLGENGTTVFMRLSAFVMLCLGIQILWGGLHELLLSLLADALILPSIPKVS